MNNLTAICSEASGHTIAMSTKFTLKEQTNIFLDKGGKIMKLNTVSCVLRALEIKCHLQNNQNPAAICIYLFLWTDFPCF